MLDQQIKQQVESLAMEIELLLDKRLATELLVLVFGQLDFFQCLFVFFEHRKIHFLGELLLLLLVFFLLLGLQLPFSLYVEFLLLKLLLFQLEILRNFFLVLLFLYLFYHLLLFCFLLLLRVLL